MSQLHSLLNVTLAPHINENFGFTYLDAPTEADTGDALRERLRVQWEEKRELTRMFGYFQGHVVLAPFGAKPVSDEDMATLDHVVHAEIACMIEQLTGHNYLSGSVTIACTSGGIEWASVNIDSAIRSAPIHANDRPGLGDP